MGVARQNDYSTSKFAAFGFNESLRSELRVGRTGVRTRFPRLFPILKEDAVATGLLPVGA